MGNRLKFLRVYLYVFGILNLITAITLPLFFGDILLWQPRNLPTDLMVGSLYLAIGIIMILVAKDPREHKSFIDFLILSSLFHAIVMVVYAQSYLHIILDATFMGLMGLIPLIIYPWGVTTFLRYR